MRAARAAAQRVLLFTAYENDYPFACQRRPALLLSCAPVLRALDWDTNPAAAGAQGATVSPATWDAVTLNWWNGAANVAWAANVDAVFGGLPGTVQVAGSTVANDLTFSAGTLTPTASAPLTGLYQVFTPVVAGQHLTLAANGGDAPTVQVGTGFTAVIAANTAGAGLAGSAGFEKTGAGTLIVQRNGSGVTHPLDGTIQVLEGRLAFDGFSTSTMGGQDPYPNLDAVIVSSGAVLSIDRPAAMGDFNQPAVTLNGGTLLLTSGYQTLTSLTLNGGTVGTGNPLTTSGAADEGLAEVLRSRAAGLTVTSLANAATSTIGVDMGTVDGAITFNVADGAANPDLALMESVTYVGGSAVLPVTKTGAGTMRLGAASSFQGDLVVNGGLVVCGVPSALGAATGTGGAGEGEVRVASGAAVDLNGQAGGTNKSWFIAGHGPGNTGAVRNTGASILDNSRLVDLTLTAAASVGGTGHFDIGWNHNAGAAGSISGGGFTFTKRGTNTVRFRAAATNIICAVESGILGGMVDDAFGSGTITLSGGELRGFGKVSFANRITTSAPAGLGAEDDRVIFTNTISAGGKLTADTGTGAALHFNSALTGNGHQLEKTGAGTLFLNAANSHTGETLVSLGTLSGTGTVQGLVTIGKNGTLAPGNRYGTFATEGSAVVAGTWRMQISGTDSARFAVSGSLSLESSSTLAIDPGSSLTENAYILATYGSLDGTFRAVTGLSSNYSVDYRYNGLKQIALVKSTLTGYAAWAAARGLAGSNAAADADPDKDGIANAVEFVLGGEPNPANPGSQSSALLPTFEVTATHLIVTHRRADDAAYLNPAIRYSPTLGPWTTAVHGTGGVTITPTNDHFGPGIDRVVVSIPRSGNFELSAQLVVTVP